LDEAKAQQYFGKALQQYPAQLLQLEEAVKLFHPEEQTSTANVNAGGTASTSRTAARATATENDATDSAVTKAKSGAAMSAQEVVQLLQNNAGITNSFLATAPMMPTTTSAGETVNFGDPYQFGRDNCASKRRQVVDFVSCLNRGEDTTVVNLGGVEFRSVTSKKPQHDRLSPYQYMEGAMRILRAMVLEDGASIEQIMDYVNYVIQIGVFAQTYTWPSTLGYDQEYRQQQQELGFRWGTGSAFLMSSRLQRPVPTLPTKKVSANVKQPKDPKSGSPICQRFNGVNGCTLSRCNFAHVCRACFADHPEWQHKQNKVSQATVDQPKN
jgi:hypothetical protein